MEFTPKTGKRLSPEEVQSRGDSFTPKTGKRLQINPPSQDGLLMDTKIQEPKGEQGIKGFGVGAGKGGLSTLRGGSSLGERIATGFFKGITTKKFQDRTPALNQEKTAAEKLIPEEAITPHGRAEKAGFFTEQAGEFLIPGSKIAKLSKGKKLLTRVGIEAGAGAGQTAVQQGELNETVRNNAIIGGLFPVGGALLKAGFQKATSGGIRKKLGAKIQESVIRASKVDVEDGFKIENVNKHKLGGNLQQTFEKTQEKLNSLGSQLKERLKGSNASLNLNNIIQKTKDKLSVNKDLNFGNNQAISRVIKSLENEALEQSGENGLVDLIQANNIKRGAGTKGAWVFGSADPDASAIEKVYTAFYREIKEEIEKLAPEGIKSINKQLSDLIPISNAVIRRIPVENRNNAISLTDSMGLFASMFDVKALSILGVQRLLKSGKFGAFLSQSAEKAKQRSLTEPIKRGMVSERVFGGNIRDLKDLPVGLSVQDVSEAFAKRPALEAALKDNGNLIRRLEAQGITGPDMKNALKVRADLFKQIDELVKRTNPVKKKVLTPSSLSTEAKKFNNVDDFIESQPKVFRSGTGKERIEDVLKQNRSVVWFTNSAKEGRRIAFERNSNLQTAILGTANTLDVTSQEALLKSLNIISFKDKGLVLNRFNKNKLTNYEISTITADPNIQKPLIDLAKEKGFDVVKMFDDGLSGNESVSFAVLNKDVIKTKSQLTDIFNKANTTKPLNSSASLINEAKEFNNVDEFIKAELKDDKTYRISHQVDLKNSTKLNEVDIDNLIEFHKSKNGVISNIDSKEIQRLKKLQGSPESDITIYRASPTKGLNDGDWITIDKTYAEDIKRQNGGKVFSYKVKAGELYHPNNFDDLPSLARFSAFKYESKAITQKKSQLTDIFNKANQL